MRFPRSRWRPLVTQLAATALAAATPVGTSAQELSLKFAREIEPPYRRALPAPGAADAADREHRAARDRRRRRGAATHSRPAGTGGRRAPRRGARRHLPARGPSRGRGGRSASRHRAASSCARGARRCSPTGCNTTSPTTRSGARATSRCARARTGSAGPRSSSSAAARSATSTSRSSTSARTRRTAAAREIRFAGPDMYEASNAQYTTCVAPNNDWYLRSDEIEVDKLRKVGTARNAMVYFLDVPGHVHAVARVSAVQRAQVGLPDADDRLHADRAASRSRRRTTSTSRRTTTRRSRRGS